MYMYMYVNREFLAQKILLHVLDMYDVKIEIFINVPAVRLIKIKAISGAMYM